MNSASAAVESVPKRRTAWYFFLLAMASLMWSAQGTAVKFLDRKMGPIAITFIPFYICTLLMIPLLLRSRRQGGHKARLSAADWRQFAIAGIAGQILAQLGMTWGISESLASNGAILNLLIPVISAVLASMLLRERLTLLRIACLAIGLCGVLLLSAGDLKQSSFTQMKYLGGNLLIFGGCLGSSFYNVYCKRLMDRFTEIEILMFSYVTASLASLPLVIWVEPFHFDVFGTFDVSSWLAFLFLALFMYGASMLLFFAALQHLDVTTASASLYLVPVFGVALAAGFLGESLSVVALGGAVIVLLSTLAIMKYDVSY